MRTIRSIWKKRRPRRADAAYFWPLVLSEITIDATMVTMSVANNGHGNHSAHLTVPQAKPFRTPIGLKLVYVRDIASQQRLFAPKIRALE